MKKIQIKKTLFFILIILLGIFAVNKSVYALGISFLSESHLDGGSISSINVPINVNSGETVVIVVSEILGTVSSITDAGGSVYTKLVSKNDPADTRESVEVWGTLSASPSSSVTVNFSNPVNASVSVLRYSGVTSFGNTNTNNGITNSTRTVSVVTQDAGNFIVFGFMERSSLPTCSLVNGSFHSTCFNASQGSINLSSGDNTSVSPTALSGSYTSNSSTSWTGAGVELRSSTETPSPTPPSDTTAPSVPTNLSATAISTSQINLTWTASTDPSGPSGQVTSGVTGYKIYRSGVQIGTSATNSYSDTGLSASTSYLYTVSSYDGAGNNSSQSSSSSVITQSIIVSSGDNLFVTPTGSGNRSGIDWNNSFAGLPSTLVRGKTYYLADGSYTSYNFTTQNSGNTLIYIKKAISTDHGTDVGWNVSTMGSGQAIFGPGSSGNGPCFPWFNRDSGVGNYILDGQVGSGEGVIPYGIKLDTSQCSTISFTRGIELTNSSNVAVRYVEVQGLCNGISPGNYRTECDHITDNHASESSGYIFGSSNITLEHMWFHDTGNGGIDVGTTSNLIWQNSIVTRMTYTASQHTNALSAHGGTNGIIIRYNVFHDIEGTGGITSLNSGGPVTDANWEIYGNVFWGTSGNPYERMFFQNGAIACINGNECPGWKIYNNSFVNLRAGYMNGVGWHNSATAAVKPIIQNNIWYNSVNANFTNIPNGYNESYNSFLNSTTNTVGGTQDVINSSASSPFVNWQNGNFNLASGMAGLSLSSLYNNDFLGQTRGADGVWDRGAFEYSSGSSSAIPVLGDLNSDHTVNATDSSLLSSKWNQNYSAYDLNNDGIINSLDFALLKSNWGKTW